MALRQTKKISELPALTPATLDTTFVVGISGNTTYKISINQLTSSLDSAFATDLVTTALSGTLDGKLSTSSFNSYTASISTASLVTSITNLNTFTASVTTASIVTSISNLNTFTASVSTASLVTSITNINNATSSYELKGSGILSGSVSYTSLTNIPQGIVSQSTDLSSLNTFTASISTASLVNRLNAIENVSGSWITESETGSFLTSLNGAISGAGQIESLGFVTGSYAYLTEFNSLTQSFNIISGSVVNITNAVDVTQLNNTTASLNLFTQSIDGRVDSLENATSSYLTSLSGAISSSSQLTSSFDTRYTLSGSVQNIELPENLVSGSSQLTASYDTRYALSSSLSSISSSFNSRFNGLVTTGSNTFSGSQIFSGSMTVTSGQVIASTITNNSSSLFLQSGSNLYVQNDGIVEITGSLKVNGTTTFASVGGDEGGEIQFGVPTTNTTLQNRVTVDIWQNRLRIFEGSAGANGVYIDLSKPTTGNNNEITYKASGIVNAGTFVTLDNIKATVTTSGQRGLSLATVSGTIAINMAGNYAGAAVGASGYSGTATITTTPSTSLFGWGFTLQGDFANYIITDTTNSKAYRIIIQIGNAFNNNLVSIERLH